MNGITKTDPTLVESSEPEGHCNTSVVPQSGEVKLIDIQKRALEILAQYDELNLKQRGCKWTAKDHAMGFVGDVGDLMKLVLAKEDMRAGAAVDSRLGHELADCLWSVFVLANHYGIDVEKEFTRTMDYLEKRITKELAA